VSWSELEQTQLHYAPSPTESDRFGLPVARLTLPTGFDDWAELTHRLQDSPAVVIITRFRSGDLTLPATLATTGWDLITAGGLVYWEGRGLSAPKQRPGRLSLEAVGQSARSDPALVEGLVQAIFNGYVSHYRYNPLFQPEAALAGYQDWARRTVTDQPQHSVMLFDGDQPVGLATMIVAAGETGERAHCEVELAGLIPQVQHQGWYQHLLGHCLNRTVQLGLPRLVISTQSHNNGVQRAWARLGLLPFASVETVHLVRPGWLQNNRGRSQGL
jgi:hypothetical protein